MMIKEPVDIQALALSRYPQPEQEAERAAFIEGFLTADPAKAKKDIRRTRRKYGVRSGVFRSLKKGESVRVPFRDRGDWNLWRTTASLFRRAYGCRFSVTRDKTDRTMLNIHRYE